VRGLDTNILVRLFTGDDPDQARKAEAFLEETEEEGGRLHVSSVTLCELAWVLRSRYRMSRQEISLALQSLLDVTILEVQDRDLVRRALDDFISGSASFPDYLIGWQNWHAGCKDTLTFDRTLSEYAGFTLLS
jgi:predicted nucleic-acid-binding protein